MKIDRDTILIGAILAGSAWVLLRGLKGVASDAVVGAGNIVAGVVEGAGNVVGLPSTNKDKCAQAKASGSILDESLYCTAPDFIGSQVDKVGGFIGAILNFNSTAK